MPKRYYAVGGSNDEDKNSSEASEEKKVDSGPRVWEQTVEYCLYTGTHSAAEICGLRWSSVIVDEHTPQC